MMNKIGYLFFFLSFSLATFAQGTYTLEEAKQYALQNNNNLRKAKLDVEDAEGSIKEFKSIGMPKVSANLDYQYFIQIPSNVVDFGNGPNTIEFGRDNNVKANITASSLLFDGSYLVGLKAQRLFKDLVKKRIKASEFEVKNAVTKAYLTVLITKKNVDILDLNINNLKTTLTETKAIYESGFAEQLDVERLELSLANLEVEREKVRQIVDITLNILKFQMGYPMEQAIEVKDDIDILVNDALVNKFDPNQTINFKNRPEYIVLQETEQLRTLQLKSIKRKSWPSLSAYVSHEQNLIRKNLFDSNEINWIPATLVGVGLKVPIFDGMERNGTLQRTRVEYEKLLLDTREFERAVILETNNAKVNYNNAKEAIGQRQKNVELAQKIYETTRIKYKEGIGSSFEVTQAESGLYTAQANFVNALYDLLVAKTDLEKALGEL